MTGLGGRVSPAVARRPATDQAHKIGSLLMNPGGPGGSAIQLIEEVPLPAALTKRFSLNERTKLQFSGQFYNLLNHSQFIPGFPRQGLPPLS